MTRSRLARVALLVALGAAGCIPARFVRFEAREVPCDVRVDQGMPKR